MNNQSINIIQSEDDNSKTKIESPRPSTLQQSDTSLSDSHTSVHDSDTDNLDEFDLESYEYNEGDYYIDWIFFWNEETYVGQFQEVLREKGDTTLYCKFVRMTIGEKTALNIQKLMIYLLSIWIK